MTRSFLTYSTTAILQAVASGYLYGFDIIGVTGLPSGTVYPALRRLESAGCLASNWEAPALAQAGQRPPRKYYELTAAGREALAEAVRRYRLLEQMQPHTPPKPSRA